MARDEAYFCVSESAFDNALGDGYLSCHNLFDKVDPTERTLPDVNIICSVALLNTLLKTLKNALLSGCKPWGLCSGSWHEFTFCSRQTIYLL